MAKTKVRSLAASAAICALMIATQASAASAGHGGGGGGGGGPVGADFTVAVAEADFTAGAVGSTGSLVGFTD